MNKPWVTFAILIVVLQFMPAIHPSYAQTASTPADSTSLLDSYREGIKFNEGDSDSVTMATMSLPPRKPSDWLGGGRIAGARSWYKHESIESQIARFQSSTDVAGGWGFIFGGSVSYKFIVAELEFGLDDEDADFFGGTHTIAPRNDYWGVWLRYRYSKPFGLPVYISPGASIAYTWGELLVWDKEMENEDATIDSTDQLLYGEDITYAAGVMVEVGVIPGGALAIEYRYRWAKITDVEVLNGGGFYFPENPELDFSGHLLTFGLSVYGPME